MNGYISIEEERRDRAVHCLSQIMATVSSAYNEKKRLTRDELFSVINCTWAAHDALSTFVRPPKGGAGQ